MSRNQRWHVVLSFLKCLLSWNCIVGKYLFVVIVSTIGTWLHTGYAVLQAIGLVLCISAVRQFLAGRALSKQAQGRQARSRLLLGVGYMVLAFPCLLDPDWLKWPDAVWWSLLLIGAAGVIGGLVMGRGQAPPSCAVSSGSRQA